MSTDTTTTTDTPTSGRPTTGLAAVELGLAHDLYREIHKGIRFAMFHTTLHAGRVDVGDADDVEHLLERCTDLVELLDLHHHHEDAFVQPLVLAHAPDLALVVDAQHADVDGGLATMRLLGERLATASHVARDGVAHHLYLHLTRFTATYLEHQLFEETEVMPVLCGAVPVSELEALHAGIRQSIAPDVMVEAMSVMLPAMNVSERAAMLGGMSMAPAPVFEIFRSAAESALGADEYATVAARIGLS